MINQKYYNDMLSFPDQFEVGFKLASSIKLPRKFNRVVICGMGGSSYYVGLINNILQSKNEKLQIIPNRGYSLPVNTDENTLFFVVSFSGNTEEVIENYRKIKANGFSSVILTSGGKLEEIAKEDSIPFVKIPKGTEPRLSSGYFIAAVLQILINLGLIADFSDEILGICEKVSNQADKGIAKKLAENIHEKLPIFYATENIKASAEIAKTKLNENSKVQAFWNYFPELNHNEMVGFTNLVTNPYFVIFRSKFAHKRNLRRIEVFKKLMEERNMQVQVIESVGKSVIEELLMNYSLMDFVSYYLAELLGIDPEPVRMVEEFKTLL